MWWQIKGRIIRYFYGFTCCSNHKTKDEEYRQLLKKMKSKLLKDREIFINLARHKDEGMNNFAELTLEGLENKKENWYQ